MATDVLLVQHAERLSRPGDPGLTARGRRQAAAVAARIEAVHPRLVCSSPLVRAHQTAEPVAEAAHVDLKVDDRLRERSSWPGPDVITAAEFEADWAACTRDREWRPRVGSSSRDTGRRMRAVVLAAAHHGDDGPVVLVTHAGCTIDLLRDVLGDRQLEHRYPEGFRVGLPSTAVTHLWVNDEGAVRVLTIADVSHLPANLVSV